VGTHWCWTDESRARASIERIGRCPTDETRAKMSAMRRGPHPHRVSAAFLAAAKLTANHFQCGELNPSWKGGIKTENAKIRTSVEYDQWRISVFIRDGRVCQKCGVGGRSIQAHHLWNFFDHEDLRLDANNGITLCRKCHKRFHHLFGMKDNTPDEMRLFLLMSEE
jgi:hypothetical protein